MANKFQQPSKDVDETLPLQSFVKSVFDTGEAVAKQTHKLIENITHAVGEVADSIGNNWLIRRLSGVLNLNWLVGAVDSVNLDKAEEVVRKLKLEHPNESPSQISHRIMVEKATKAGAIGLATSILPGTAIALLAIDLAATTQLQSEMVYEIAALYGLDLKDPARKGEVLAIFGLALGGGRLLKQTGLVLLRNVPFAGAAIGASSNATMIYSLGYAACRFYEAKLDASKSVTSSETLAQLKQESENYLQDAIAQEAVMDQILVHMILASYPDKTWEEILPQLQALNLSPQSLEAIAKNIKSPLPLDRLLNKLSHDFAIPLLAQCRRIAQFNAKNILEQEKVIQAITSKFNLSP
ncbi:MAG: EcsC family protein [Cyanomargarita calcarea GSE-NOS-MK-12-04C]|jgi:uncharacterized protein (DUF697 family)|uniref:EcsC family protein n=1 Tax=Cyanomargarita calcarea GSE-NOS-MK-12-04C TaxID=2839659 RepID=A0A951QKY0_9CYAN|nr:EcsC family protein [Cyanomargarita calcarea GSE-NOS-MK-12-04C]